MKRRRASVFQKNFSSVAGRLVPFGLHESFHDVNSPWGELWCGRKCRKVDMSRYYEVVLCRHVSAESFSTEFAFIYSVFKVFETQFWGWVNKRAFYPSQPGSATSTSYIIWNIHKFPAFVQLFYHLDRKFPGHSLLRHSIQWRYPIGRLKWLPDNTSN